MSLSKPVSNFIYFPDVVLQGHVNWTAFLRYLNESGSTNGLFLYPEGLLSLGVLLTDAQYAVAVAAGTLSEAIIAPDMVTRTTPEAERAEYKAKYELYVQHVLLINTFKQLMVANSGRFLDSLKDPITGFSKVTPQEMFNLLHSMFATPTDETMAEWTQTIRTTTVQQGQTIDDGCYPIVQAQLNLVGASAGFSVYHLVCELERAVADHPMYRDTVKAYLRANPRATRTAAALITYVRINHHHYAQATLPTAGYMAAAAPVVPPPAAPNPRKTGKIPPTPPSVGLKYCIVHGDNRTHTSRGCNTVTRNNSQAEFAHKPPYYSEAQLDLLGPCPKLGGAPR